MKTSKKKVYRRSKSNIGTLVIVTNMYSLFGVVLCSCLTFYLAQKEQIYIKWQVRHSEWSRHEGSSKSDALDES